MLTQDEFKAFLSLPAPRFDAVLSILPEGWMWDWAGRLLYILALKSNGPVLEIGSLAGRSTCCLALGVRDSNLPRPFITTDLHFASTEQFLNYYRAIHGPQVQIPSLQAKLINEGGTRSHLVQNLERLGLSNFVTILTGDFVEVAPCHRYSLVFCDASHDDAEIRRNMPGIESLTGSGSIIICDDIQSQASAVLVDKHLRFSWWQLLDRILVGVRK